jgi:hypothetical protein
MSIGKNGIWKHSGSPNENLLKGTYFTLEQTTNGGSNKAYSITSTDLAKLKAGTQLTVSVDIEVYNVSSWSRIGVEPSFYASDGQGTMYIGAWTTDKTNRKQRISATHILRSDATGMGQNSVYIQGVTFGDGGYIKLSNPKLEISAYPTSWVPNLADNIYIENTNGFIEYNDKARIQKNDYIEANNFIEI